MSVVTEFEIYSGAPELQRAYWHDLLHDIQVLSFDTAAAKHAVSIHNKLKQISKQIDTADLFIAATAMRNNLPIATLNKKHFERIPDLLLIDLISQ
ncbi:type II toxin-antitoxin system VapC family toxin [Mucilaginibacter sp. UYNi724]